MDKGKCRGEKDDTVILFLTNLLMGDKRYSGEEQSEIERSTTGRTIIPTTG
jgi:hypothetical protein